MRRSPFAAALPALLGLFAATTALAAPTMLKWPPWISIETPPNPYVAGRDVLLLVHVAYREGTATLDNFRGSAEGIVDGRRQTIPLRFEGTAQPATFSLTRQWPATGAWIVRITAANTTAIVSFDRSGRVASVDVPTAMTNGIPLPREVSSREIDSSLAVAARR